MPDLLREITQAARAYYDQWQYITPTDTDLQDWRQGLPPMKQAQVSITTLAVACTLRNFQRFCLEWRGYSMRRFMSQQLSAEAFALWQQNQEFNGDLPADGT